MFVETESHSIKRCATTRVRVFGVVVCLAAAFVVNAIAQEAAPVELDWQSSNRLRQDFGIPADTAQRIAITDVAPDTKRVHFLQNGAPRSLILRKHSVLSKDVRVYSTDAAGNLISIDPPPVTTYRGEIEGDPGSAVAASIVDGQMSALVVSSDGVSVTVQPIEDFGLIGKGISVVYDSALPPPVLGVCGTVGPGAVLQNHVDPINRMALNGGSSTIFFADLAIDADFEFFQANQSSVSVTIANITNIVNLVNSVYERDCAMTYSLTTIIVRSTPNDPYTQTDSLARLNEFRNEWNTNQSGVVRDTAHLFTGVDITNNGNSNGIGRAYDIGVFCTQSSSYALSEDLFTPNLASRTALVAHEIGHLLNAHHCDNDPSGACFGTTPCNIMCSGLGGCDGIGLPNFSPCEANAIIWFAGSNSCIAQTPGVWVDFSHIGVENGSFDAPYNTLAEGLAHAGAGGNILFFPGSSSITPTINQPVTFSSPFGSAVIGQ